ncbi:MAG: hypothetical protein J6X33_01000 [Clostridiales bacterium]|nr:hypothetical protein [Clostridiales bacterium]
MDVETARLINHICGSPWWFIVAAIGIASFVCIFIVKGKRKAIPIVITVLCGVIFLAVNIICMYTYTLIPEPDSDWLSLHAIRITSAGEVNYETCETNEEGDEKVIRIPATVQVTASGSDNEEGIKEVAAEYKCDLSVLDEGYRINQWMSAFDRYTGTSFEFENKTATADEVYSGGTVFEARGETIKVNMEYAVNYDKEGKTLTVTIKVRCPSDYDGTVFQLGYADNAITEANNELDHESRLYTIDELPGFDTNGHEYLYFSASGR